MLIGIILAAGNSSRFSKVDSKQFFKLHKRPVLYYSLKAFIDADCFDKIIIVTNKFHFKAAQDLIEMFTETKGSISICEGGSARQTSVYHGVLKAIELNGGTASKLQIVTHDGARPALPKSIIIENVENIRSGRCVNTVKKVYDTMLYDFGSGKVDFIDREKAFAVLTPQSFNALDYIVAYRAVENHIAEYTCVCSVMTANGCGMDLIVSDYPIRKITVKSDINAVKQDLKDILSYE